MPREHLSGQQGLLQGGKAKGLAGVGPSLALPAAVDFLGSLWDMQKQFSQPLSPPVLYVNLVCSLFLKAWRMKSSSTQLPQLETAEFAGRLLPPSPVVPKSIPVFPLFSLSPYKCHFVWTSRFQPGLTGELLQNAGALTLLPSVS